MFGYELKSKTRKETIDEVLSLIDNAIERLQEMKDDYYVKAEGYAHSKDYYQSAEVMKKITTVQDRIYDFDLLRKTIEYRYHM